MAGSDTNYEAGSSPNGTDNGNSEHERRNCSKPDLSNLRLPSPADLRAIARDRALSLAAPAIAKRLGCLKVGKVCGFPSWILTDPAGCNAEARRFGRLIYPAVGQLSERKAHTLKHSSKGWPLGLGIAQTLVERAALIAVTEGGPVPLKRGKASPRLSNCSVRKPKPWGVFAFDRSNRSAPNGSLSVEEITRKYGSHGRPLH